jgi:adhesin transport system outer membrane protein
MNKKHWTMIVPGAVLLAASPAFGVELRDAVQSAINTNPEIRQAVANRVATQEERVQGQGLYYPRISVEGSAGVRRLRNPTRRQFRNPPPGVAHRCRRGTRGGARRVRCA